MAISEYIEKFEKSFRSNYLNPNQKGALERKWKYVSIANFQKYWNIHDPDFASTFYKATSQDNLFMMGRINARKIMRDFALYLPEQVRQIFVHLYDEEIELKERIKAFKKECSECLELYNQSAKKMLRRHGQSNEVISIYLYLRYPDRYFRYHYRSYLAYAQCTEMDVTPKRGDVVGYFKCCHDVSRQLEAHPGLNQIFNELKEEEYYYSDLSRHVMTSNFMSFLESEL